jgi:hypothetical protein
MKPPSLTLMKGKSALDPAALAKMYERLTGRKPTEQQIADAKVKLKARKKS